MDFRTKLLEAGGCTFCLDVAAGEAEELTRFSMRCGYRTDETAELTLTAPETLSGIRARAEQDGGTVLFDDVSVAFPTLANGSLAPMAAAWLLGSCWQNAYIEASGTEGDYLRVTYLFGYGNRELTVDCWFDEAFAPAHAEIASDGKTVLQAELSDFTFASLPQMAASFDCVRHMIG